MSDRTITILIDDEKSYLIHNVSSYSVDRGVFMEGKCLQVTSNNDGHMEEFYFEFDKFLGYRVTQPEVTSETTVGTNGQSTTTS